MILPILVYNDLVLRKQCKELTPSYSQLEKLIANMFETMYNAKGVGLAASQIGLDLRLFIVDTTPFSNDKNNEESRLLKNFKKVFINAKILKNYGETWKFREGCLSLPEVMGHVKRSSHILIEYYDEHWNKHTETLDRIRARVIQHEYDHIEGKLFIDHLSSLKRQLVSNKLKDISEGKIKIDYPIKPPLSKNK
ncbi:MAG: peptide deformylase [Flavobacteriales bacterium AspAUS03]